MFLKNQVIYISIGPKNPSGFAYILVNISHLDDLGFVWDFITFLSYEKRNKHQILIYWVTKLASLAFVRSRYIVHQRKCIITDIWRYTILYFTRQPAATYISLSKRYSGTIVSTVSSYP